MLKNLVLAYPAKISDFQSVVILDMEKKCDSHDKTFSTKAWKEDLNNFTWFGEFVQEDKMCPRVDVVYFLRTSLTKVEFPKPRNIVRLLLRTRAEGGEATLLNLGLLDLVALALEELVGLLEGSKWMGMSKSLGERGMVGNLERDFVWIIVCPLSLGIVVDMHHVFHVVMFSSCWGEFVVDVNNFISAANYARILNISRLYYSLSFVICINVFINFNLVWISNFQRGMKNKNRCDMFLFTGLCLGLGDPNQIQALRHALENLKTHNAYAFFIVESGTEADWPEEGHTIDQEAKDAFPKLVKEEMRNSARMEGSRFTFVAVAVVLSLLCAASSTEIPFMVVHKKASLAKVSSDTERLTVTIDLYNRGSTTAYDVSLNDDSWPKDLFNLVSGNTSSSWDKLDVGAALSHSFVLESKVKGLFYGRPAVVKYRVAAKSALQEAYSTPIEPLDILAERPPEKKYEWAKQCFPLTRSHPFMLLERFHFAQDFSAVHYLEKIRLKYSPLLPFIVFFMIGFIVFEVMRRSYSGRQGV
ncbi:hypothetical protein KI387_001443 [Taxus chinensis]|uniref:Uncharacterized protein n=1 Tax=Taxus chinensis TaxID=29808 RepID=A0AA38GXV5_TAXCH|nr:hypothetical protein KI387_001443 [Taxus chinensis]